jgi:hypothetical protein
VGVFPEPGDGQQAAAIADPVHPAGARMFAVAAPVVDSSVSVELVRGVERVEQVEVQVDGPVGG